MSKPVRMQSALKWAFVMSWGPSTIASLLTFVLAMYLGPKDYGLVAIAALYMQFNKMFLENGLGAAIVQRKNLEPQHCDAAFWLTLILSFVLMGVCWILAPYWASVNQNAFEVTQILQMLSFVMPIQGLTVVQQSLLERKMDFKSLAIRSNVSALVGGLFGLYLATQRYGAYALIGEDLLGAGVRFVLLWRLGSWRPTFRFSWRHLKDLWSFSIFVLIGQIGTFIQRRSDALLIGVFFGPAAVGIYRLADRLINMIIEMATRPFVMVVLPRFSQLQDKVDELRKSVKQYLGGSAMLTMPLLAILAGLAYLICSTLSARGKDWNSAIQVIQILALVGAVRAVTLFTGPLVQSINRPRLFMTMSWGLAALNVAGFCVAGWWLSGSEDVKLQAIGVATDRAGVFCLVYAPLCLWIMAMICKTTIRDLLGVTLRAAFVAGMVLAVGAVMNHVLQFIPAHTFWPRLGRLAIGGAVTTSLAMFLMFKLEPRVKEFLLGRFAKKKRKDAVAVANNNGQIVNVHAGTGEPQVVLPPGETPRVAVDR
jgi:teichuronic acid exporter